MKLKKTSRLSSLLAVSALLAAPIALAANSNGYYRYPSIANDTIIFSSEGDLWKVTSTGGNATRLTTHAAEETHPVISADGQWVAFTANYNGGLEVYVMSTAGGIPKQVSFEGARVLPQAWTSDNKLIYSAPSEIGPLRQEALYLVDPRTNTRDAIPLADANQATITDNNKTLYFVRGGLHLSNDNARYYRGGNAASLWTWTLGSREEAIQISPKDDRSYRHPMYWNNTLYFVSEDKGTDNLWSMNIDGSNLRALTNHQDFEVKFPKISNGKIVYQHGADLRVFDTTTGSDKILPIELVSDFEQTRTRWISTPLDYLTQLSLSADGEKVALIARGTPLVASNSPLRKMQMAIPDSVIATDSKFSPDGKYLYLITDQSGEQEIWRYPVNGQQKPEQLTDQKIGQRWAIKLSPNGEWIAHDNKKGELWLLNTKTLANTKIDDGNGVFANEFPDLEWSADSRYIAYSKPNNLRGIPQIVLHEIATGKTEIITSDKYPSFEPSFSVNGEWLYFLSNRQFNATPSSPWGDRNMGVHFDKRTQVYAKKNSNKEKSSEKDKGDGKKKTDEKLIKIDFENIQERLYQVPVDASNYQALSVATDRLYLQETSGDQVNTLKTIAISNDNPKLETFFEGLGEFTLSADRKKMAVTKAQKTKVSAVYIFETGAKASTELDKAQIQLNGWKLAVNPRQEWRQMFNDAWRMQRDFLYDPKMRGVDWVKAKARYQPLLERVNSRQELDDLIAQMNAELSVLHSQMRSGDVRKDKEQVAAAMLGAVLKATPQGYEVVHIYQGDRDLIGERSPLDMPNVAIQIGDVITQVNWQEVNLTHPIYLPLLQQQGQQVRLDFMRKGKADTSIVTPIDSWRHALLKYGDWERQLLERVTKASKGKIGYLHLRAMGGNDIAGFARDFFSQIDKDAIIIDVRRNNGGNIDSWIIQQFLRETWSFWAQEKAPAYWNMQQTFRGHVAFLIDELTYSDGETFAAGVKALGLGPLIGKRTSGAGVWLSDRNRLVDGGMARAAEYAQFRADGEWMIEGRGVAPDIEISNLPFATFNGTDAQLDEAIRYLTEKLKSHPIPQAKPKALSPVGKPASDVLPLR